MIDTVKQSIKNKENTQAGLIIEGDEYLKSSQLLQYTQNNNESINLAGKQLTNFQQRLIEKISLYNKPIEVALYQVPEKICKEDVHIAFKQYHIRNCYFKRLNCFFNLPKDQANQLVQETNLRITIKGENLLIVMLPLKI
ncbi:unnamed protein product [Paramecium pentaurelia]|uniref:Uncharacterized protein n=1 Tax=Paramecium pentaurelia TaxID=43138 RepID=A0A8S1SJU7_9CILI|nr:unnamed protein product [Paramecium pentaurelia]